MRLLAILALASAASALVPRWDDLAVKHAWAEVPRGWIEQGPAPPEHKMTFRIGLKQARGDELIRQLYAVSDPASAQYGRHLSAADVSALVAPAPATTSAVNAWLAHHNVSASAATPAGDWLALTLSVAQAERMLGARYAVYAHPGAADVVVRTLSYRLPRALHAHVDVVAPTTYFGTLRAMRTHSRPAVARPAEPLVTTPGADATVPSSCSSSITPACLKALYNITYTPVSTATNKLGVAGYLEEYANDADLKTFAKKYMSSGTAPTFQHVQVNGGLNDQSNPGGEANLDIQYTTGLSYPTPNIYYSTGGSPPFTADDAETSNGNEPYLNWLNYVLNQTTIPQTFTTSYGDDEQTVPRDYATSVCNLFAQLGARGSSIMFSSGDDGVGSGDCRTNDGKNTVKFQPEFPSSCPYVTAVGGTYRVPEVAVSFSGGGFSQYFAQPTYQSAAVTKYLSAFGTTYSTYFNKTGRAYPDVAAQAVNFQVVIGGQVEGLEGTSCASPTFAGVVALLNDYRLSLGKAPLGFLNPLIYGSLTTGFNDITSGSNPSCGTNGFSSKAGWDPVTGLGTPNFGKLQALVKNL